jgi:hypothetical protein
MAEALPSRAERLRRWRLENFPYSWRYEVDDAGDVRFVAFVHAKRRPGYFKRRAR